MMARLRFRPLFVVAAPMFTIGTASHASKIPHSPSYCQFVTNTDVVDHDRGSMQSFIHRGLCLSLGPLDRQIHYLPADAQFELP